MATYPSPPARPGIPILAIGPFVILAAAGFDLWLHWDSIPARFPIHWGLDGRPNGWTMRTLAGVGLPLFIGAAVCLLILAVTAAVAHGSEPGARTRQMHSRAATLTMLVGLNYLLAVVFGCVALFPLRAHPEVSPALTPILALALLVIACGSFPLLRLARAERLAAAERGDDRADARHWRAGLFYVNPDDPALLVPKRFGIGFTLNFAHRRAWLAMAGLLLLVVLAIVLGNVV